MARSLDARAEHLLRELAPQVLGAVIRRFRDFAASEDAVQEALIAAATQWPRDGLPDNPRGWLIQVASRRMTDHVRSEVARRRREAVVAVEAELSVDAPDSAGPISRRVSARRAQPIRSAKTTHWCCCSCAAIPR